jgi:hypothetical protein
VHGDDTFTNVAHVSVLLGSVNICLTYMLTPFRPSPRHLATDSQSFLFSVNIFSHSAFGGGTRKNFSPGPELAFSDHGKAYDTTDESSLISRRRVRLDYVHRQYLISSRPAYSYGQNSRSIRPKEGTEYSSMVDL